MPTRSCTSTRCEGACASTEPRADPGTRVRSSADPGKGGVPRRKGSRPIRAGSAIPALGCAAAFTSGAFLPELPCAAWIPNVPRAAFLAKGNRGPRLTFSMISRLCVGVAAGLLGTHWRHACPAYLAGSLPVRAGRNLRRGFGLAGKLCARGVITPLRFPEPESSPVFVRSSGTASPAGRRPAPRLAAQDRDQGRESCWRCSCPAAGTLPVSICGPNFRGAPAATSPTVRIRRNIVI
jgi:hypothetical protein